MAFGSRRSGLGCMPMVGTGVVHYGAASEAESLATIQRAIDLGITFFDTAEVYGPLVNEELLGRAIRGRRDGSRDRDQVRLPHLAGRGRARLLARERAAGLRRLSDAPRHRHDRPLLPAPRRPEGPDRGDRRRASPTSSARARCATSASRRSRRRRCGAQRRSTRSPRCSPSTRCGSAASRSEILPAARALGIGFVPYSPLGRGFLTGQITRRADLVGRRLPLPRSALRGGELREEPRDRRRAPRDRSRAWRERRPDRARLASRAGRRRRADPRLEASRDPRGQREAADLDLGDAELARLDAAAPPGGTAGPRYGGFYMGMVDL